MAIDDGWWWMSQNCMIIQKYLYNDYGDHRQHGLSVVSTVKLEGWIRFGHKAANIFRYLAPLRVGSPSWPSSWTQIHGVATEFVAHDEVHHRGITVAAGTCNLVVDCLENHQCFPERFPPMVGFLSFLMKPLVIAHDAVLAPWKLTKRLVRWNLNWHEQHGTVQCLTSTRVKKTVKAMLASEYQYMMILRLTMPPEFQDAISRADSLQNINFQSTISTINCP